MTERWTGRNVTGEISRAAALLEGGFPREAGDWRAVDDLQADPQELQRAGAVGYVSRTYRNENGGPLVAAFVVCATPHEASGHTPDRCYPGAGFEIAEQEHRQNVPLTDGREAETFTGTFRKSDQTLRVFWTYGIPAKPADAKADPTAPADSTELRWVAPQIARIALNGEPYVYKLYVIVDQTKLGSSQATLECTNFLAAVLPAFNTTLAEADTKPDVGPTPPTAAAADGRPG
jgi:hypothetical protein